MRSIAFSPCFTARMGATPEVRRPRGAATLSELTHVTPTSRITVTASKPSPKGCAAKAPRGVQRRRTSTHRAAEIIADAHCAFLLPPGHSAHVCLRSLPDPLEQAPHISTYDVACTNPTKPLNTFLSTSAYIAAHQGRHDPPVSADSTDFLSKPPAYISGIIVAIPCTTPTHIQSMSYTLSSLKPARPTAPQKYMEPGLSLGAVRVIHPSLKTIV